MMLLIVNVLMSVIMPSIGNIYGKNILIPLVGYQYIETEIKKKNTVSITLSGIINEKGTAKYIKYKGGDDIIILSRNLKQLIKQFRCEFNFPVYDNNNDIIIFKLYIKPLYFNKKIVLKKIY